MVQRLLAAGAGPNRRNHEGALGETALWIAAQARNKEIVSQLLGKGAKRNLALHDGSTPDSLVRVLMGQ
ncbi:MAG TPA: hypothetical protein DIW24_09820 [Bacteroidetes bacterium]|nr:hypothetical protein [Bacteroidota bacterium]